MTANDPRAPATLQQRMSDEAIDWLVRLRSGRATAADRAAFADWRRRSPAHDAAAREAEALWRDLAGTPVAAGAALPAATGRGRPATRRAVLAGAIAASGAVLVVGPQAFGPWSGLTADHATRVGERREVRLPDGSLAALNTASALSVAYTDAERRIVLHDGEALFEVVRDPARPFIVHTADGEAEALGTVFTVRRTVRSGAVVVTEGTVEVRSHAGRSEPVRLTAGQRVAYGADGAPGQPESVDSGVATAWRRGKLIFNRRPLGDVVAELQRYRAGRIVITDARLEALEVSGIFDLADPDGLLRTIEQTLAVKLVRLPLLTLVY